MEKYLRGDVVIIPFPYSDKVTTKRRPALVMAHLRGNDLILCQITSQLRASPYCVSLTTENFATGRLPIPSFIHCSQIFTISKDKVIQKVGTLNLGTMVRVLQTFGKIFSIEMEEIP
ncbi:MAG: type II toxin-antitoxin system PemK/MazF family toxin [Bacteroidales bacterium]|nr:type II toxin-antitoxin system PemK/MazF family toxin [Bacteroidales bacterium]